MNAITQPKNSTNVRSRNEARLSALRWGFRAAQQASPDLAAWLGEMTMFRTLRMPSKPWQEEILARGRAFEVDSAAGKVAAWTWGEGPAIVLVHGWNGRGAQLGAFVDPLVAAGFQVVSFDAPGHGKSPGSTSSIIAFADALDA